MMEKQGQPDKPLSGIRVIDASRVLAGPFCGQMLADQGADVVKIESLSGDENRQWGPFSSAGESCNFMSVNRGKRGIAIDLKSAQGQSVFRRLLIGADVLLHSFLPSSAANLGIDTAELQSAFPKLVICSISAFGLRGELKDRPGYDSLGQAFSGIMSMTGHPGGEPVRAGVSFIDMSTGILAYCSVVTALLARGKTGNGDSANVSLLETGITFLGYHAVSWLEAGALPRREGSGIWNLVPYQAFSCADGGQFMTGALNDSTWVRLCKAIGRPELALDPELATNDKRMLQRDRLVSILSEKFASAPISEWTARLKSYDVPVAPIHTVDQALSHPQVLANGMVVEVKKGEQSIRLLGLPFKLGSSQAPSALPPPTLGEHTDEILRDMVGMNDEEISDLRNQRIVR